MAFNEFSKDIPVISLAGLDEAGGRRSEICKKIVQAFEDWGIFRVVDHGIDSKLISEMIRLSLDFFALPVAEKLRFDMSGGKKGGFYCIQSPSCSSNMLFSTLVHSLSVGMLMLSLHGSCDHTYNFPFQG